MNKSKTLLIILLVLVTLLIVALILYRQLSNAYEAEQLSVDAAQTGETAQTGEKEKMIAPDFTVTDLDGNEVKLSDFFGKPIVLNFWASWCGPCKSEMPDFEEKYAEYGDEIHFLMVNMTDGMQETVEAAKAYIDAQSFSFPVYYDTKSDAAITYGVMSIPATYFIDAEGYGVARASGALTGDTLQRGIDMIYQK